MELTTARMLKEGTRLKVAHGKCFGRGMCLRCHVAFLSLQWLSLNRRDKNCSHPSQLHGMMWGLIPSWGWKGEGNAITLKHSGLVEFYMMANASSTSIVASFSSSSCFKRQRKRQHTSLLYTKQELWCPNPGVLS